MIPHSQAFEDATIYHKIHKAIFEVAVFDPAGNVLFLIDPDDGGRALRDRTRPIRADCDLSFLGKIASLVPPGTDPRVLLPWGTEIRVARGFEYKDGSQELLTRAVLRITTTDTSVDLTAGTGSKIHGEDRAERLSRQLLVAFDAPENSIVEDVIVRLLQQAWQGASSTVISSPNFNITGTANDPGGPHLSPMLHYDPKTNAWDAAQKLATSIGRELYLDHDGTITLAKLPDRLNDPVVWQFVDGQDDTRISLAQSYQSSNTPNYWTVNATGPNVPSGPGGYVGTAFVDDPATSIDINGAYGTVPSWTDSTLATSNEMCTAEAEALKSKALAGTDTIIIETLNVGFLLEGDVVNSTAAQLDMADELYVIASIEETFDAQGTMKITAARG